MLLSALMLPATAHLLDIDDYGARRNDSSEPAIRANIKAFNLALAVHKDRLARGDGNFTHGDC